MHTLITTPAGGMLVRREAFFGRKADEVVDTFHVSCSCGWEFRGPNSNVLLRVFESETKNTWWAHHVKPVLESELMAELTIAIKHRDDNNREDID